MRLRVHSLQAQLALKLAAVFSLATVLAVCAVVYEGTQAAKTLGDDELQERAIQLARFISRGPDGIWHLELPPRQRQIYDSPARTRLLAARTSDGGLIASTDAEFAAVLHRWPAMARERHAFRLEDFGAARQDYNGITVRVQNSAGPLWVSVAAVSDADALAYGIMKGFIVDVAWSILLFAAAMLAVAVWSIRRGLKPVLAASEMAAAIGPNATTVRLPTNDLPTELRPLVAGVNAALDRLEQGFAVQRQFTANAAHELRTPLAILTTGLDALNNGPEVDKLRNDVSRMNRLVDQLLRVARLDSVAIDVENKMDLRATAAEVVEYMSPWALAMHCTLGFDAPPAPVWIRGNAPALNDALRNLVENAVFHTRAGTEVTVAVSPSGTVSVADQGPGIPAPDRKHIFERFWRGRGISRPGAGLGLAIVAEIVRAHHGEIQVTEASLGGALMLVKIPLYLTDA
jgi:two-component system, OmpR family, sensor histidine kinase TctE